MTEDDDFHSVRTLLRTFDLDPITRPDPEQAIRRGRRHRRVRTVDRVLALASVAVVVFGGVALSIGPLRSAVAPSPTVGVTMSPSPTPEPSTSTTKSQLVDVANGSTVDAGKSGAVLRLTAAGMCTEPAAGLSRTQINEIPTACYDPRSTNFDLAASGWVGGNAGWGTHSLYYGLTTTAASAVTVTDAEGHIYLGTLARIPGANWYAFYVVTPFAPFTIDAQHPIPPRSGTVLVTDAQGNPIGRNGPAPSIGIYLPTSDWKSGDPARQALLGGVLSLDGSGCVVARSGSLVTAILWPQGYTARSTDTGAVEVLNSAGAIVARAGDQFSAGGGADAPSSRISGRCVDGYQQVFVVESDLKPLP